MDLHVSEISKNSLYFGPDVTPVEISIAGAKWRKCNRPNVVFLNHTSKVL